MVESILDTIKPMVGVEVENTSFDVVLIPFINSALSVITQLGVGPVGGFRIIDKTKTWAELLGTRTDLDIVITNIYCRVRLWFDPPTNSFLVTALKDQVVETDWRIESWHDPKMVLAATYETPVEITE